MVAPLKPIILLIGAGQLGSRYLQGLASCGLPLEIFVVDPSESSLTTARSCWEEAIAEDLPHRVHFSQKLEKLPAEIDLCLVSTNADVRLLVVQQVLVQAQVLYWVLEKVLAQSVEQLDQLESLLEQAQGTWVNTARRAQFWHQNIRVQLPEGRPWHAFGGKGAWGMVCNSIHLLDLLAWWTGEALESVDSTGLQDWFPSKRSGFWEATGRLKAYFSGGTELLLESDNSPGPFLLRLHNSHGEWVLEESSGSFQGPDGFSLPGKVEFQSELTGRLVEKILNEGHCQLPTLRESSKMHRHLIQSLLGHWKNAHKSNDTILPIT